MFFPRPLRRVVLLVGGDAELISLRYVSVVNMQTACATLQAQPGARVGGQAGSVGQVFAPIIRHVSSAA